jgi:HemY protein
LMARLEESEAVNMPAAREWLDRAIGAPPDPSYVCARCGGDSPQWQALCPACGGFDTLAWRIPPSGSRPVIAQPADADAPLMLPAPEMLSGSLGEAGAARS